MRALAASRRTEARDAPASRPPAALAQRRSTLADPGSVVAPPIVDAGRPLEPGVRAFMESGFGRSFEQVRVHDDARAHDSARMLDARAYATGNDLVFAEGAYRPDTPTGQALIAHELAHTVQQGGVQRKAEGPMPAGTDHALEAEADRAASAVLEGRSAPRLTTLQAPRLQRAAAGDSTPAPPANTQALPLASDIPDGMVAIKDEADPKTLIVEIANYALPESKGKGDWVQQAYTDAGGGGTTGRLVFSPLITGKSIAAYKEEDGAPYKEIWLGKFGFKTTAQLAEAFDTAVSGPDDAKGAKAVKAAAKQPGVPELIAGMHKNLQDSGCDIDHIVEKQMGGTSIASNLQLLTSKVNQTSGVANYNKLVSELQKLREPGMRGEKANKFQLRIVNATVTPGPADASYHVEKLLRDGDLSGSDAVKKKVIGSPVQLQAGGQGEEVVAHDTKPTPIPAMGKRLVPGVRLTRYQRGPGGRGSKSDQVFGRFDSKAMETHGDDAGDGKIVFSAVPSGAPAAAGAGTAGSPAGAADATAAGPAGEVRDLKLPAGANRNIKFYYPYLSPGNITKLDLDPSGNLSGEGVIHPRIKFLGDLKVRFDKDRLDLVKDIDVEQMNKSAPMRAMSGFFRFTEGAFKLDLLKFVPSGTIKFTLGPKAKPYVEGDVTARAEGTTFVAEGNVKTCPTLPGLKDGSGTIAYRSDTGWSGSLKATSSTIKGATADVSMTFAEAKNGFAIAASGTISTQVRGANLVLGAEWKQNDLSLHGEVKVKKPLPMVEEVTLKGRYAKEALTLSATTKVHWKMGSVDLHGDAVVRYNRKDGDESGTFSGSVGFTVKNEKMDGKFTVALSEAGKPTGKGELAYQITPKLRPRLSVELEPSGKVKLSGEVKVADVPLSEAWPKPPNDRKSILKGSVATNIPTPIASLFVSLRVVGELGVSYSVGPMALRGLVVKASLYPFEDEKHITAHLSGSFVIPARGGLFGRFGVLIGANLAYGAAAAEGGLYVVPEVGVRGEAGVKIDADYSDEGFSFEGEAYAKGSMYGSLGIDFAVNVSALWGLANHEWTFPVAKWGPKQLGPEINITLGKVGYGKDGKITWPSLSQIDVTPKEFDPMGLLRSVLADSSGS